MWNAILGIALIVAMPQVAGALAAWRLGWTGAAVWAWPLPLIPQSPGWSITASRPPKQQRPVTPFAERS
jgi:hypothetical protein